MSLSARQESELVQEHLAFMDLRDLHPTQPRLVVTTGARVPGLETAIVPVFRRLWFHNISSATLSVRFTGTETRQGRSVALFSIQADTSRRPSVSLRLALEGCVSLDVQTGRLQSLTGKLVPLFHGRELSDSGPRITTSITAEYP